MIVERQRSAECTFGALTVPWCLSRRSPRVRREPGAAAARQGLRAAGPATGSVPGVRRVATLLRTVDAPRLGQRSRRVLYMCGRAARRALRALEGTSNDSSHRRCSWASQTNGLKVARPDAVIALAAQMARAEAVKTPIAPVFAANSVHEPVHESWHHRAPYNYAASSSVTGAVTSVCSQLAGEGGFGSLIPGIPSVLATKPPGVTPGHHEHPNYSSPPHF
jgi:hypothetical protein